MAHPWFLKPIVALKCIPFQGRRAPAFRFRSGVLLCFFALVSPGCAIEPDPDLSFEQHVRPIFKAMCFQCHGEETTKRGDLDLRLVRLMVHGGKSGPAVAPGDSARSLLWQKIGSDEMPDGSRKLTPDQKGIIRRWIDQGARTAAAEPDNVEDARFSSLELDHWAFQPVVRPEIPRVEGYTVSTPVDAFIARRLASKGLPFSPAADRFTLLRRVAFDLTGLPPTPDEIDAFVSDPAPDAYAKVVERLLASPQFGVRWGRHWLDVAGYAESDGGDAQSDPKRPVAWRYRDYVINAFNTNKGVDDFLKEQLAGDEIVPLAPPDPGDERQKERLTATAFLRLAPDLTQSSDSLETRNLAAADSVRVMGTAILGLTVGCAQCHDHKYDPITSEDYYRFRAIFDPLFPLKDWRRPADRWVDFTPPAVRAQAEQIEAKARAVEEEINARKLVVAKEILAKKLADVPAELRDEVEAANNTGEKERTERQRRLLEDYPMVKSAQFISGFLVEYDNPAYRKFEKELETAAAIRATKPALQRVMVADERPGVVPISAVMFRGDPQAPGETVLPAELGILDRRNPRTPLPDNDASRPTTGRRLAYASVLTRGDHPLTARVFVNRLWLHHFGRGLVATPNDFGLNGDRPSHPELLDWLADDFVRHGWDQKRLHRMLLLSTVYQQQSRRNPALDAIDPQNELLGRMNLRRMEAETVRDSLLAVSRNLNASLSGPSVPVTVNGEGKAVIGEMKLRDGLPAGVETRNADGLRRSVYVEVKRSLPLNALATFDQPVMNPNCDVRRHSTVPTQALWFLNDESMVQEADALARFLIHRHGDRAEPAVRDLFMRLFAVLPSPEEMRTLSEFLEIQTEQFARNPDAQLKAVMETEKNAPRSRAFSLLCQSLMASNRFLYVD